MKVKNKKGIAILLGVLCMFILGGFLLANGKNQPISTTNKTNNMDEAVGMAIKEQGKGYSEGECITEGHIILDTEQKGKTVKIYTIASVGWFGFENGIFTKISGSGAIPTALTFAKNEHGEYSLLEYKEPMDGADYSDSLKKIFPRKLHNKVFSAHDYYPKLAKQQETQAAEYLKNIGRTAQVSVEHVEKELVNINVEASNKLFTEFTKHNSFLNSCPYWLGTKEQLENGVRYIYQTSKSKSDDGYDVIIFKKMKEDGAVVEEYRYVIVGDEPQLIK